MPDGDRTLGEVSRALENVQSTLTETNRNLEQGFVRKDLYLLEMANHRARFDELSAKVGILTDIKQQFVVLQTSYETTKAELKEVIENRKWLNRAVATAFIGALVALLVALIKVVPS